MPFEKQNANIAWCVGCGDFQILLAVKAALKELQYPTPQNTVLVSGIGQAAKLPQYVNCNYFNGLHGRAIPAAMGIKAANSGLNVIVTSGEGDMYGEGGNHFIHAIRKNPDITVIVANNMVYGLTKGQVSPTGAVGQISKTQPKGNSEEPLRPLAIAIAQNASFVARGFSKHIEQTKNLIKQGIEHKGFSLIEILQPCVSFNKTNTYQWFEENSYYLDESYNPTDFLNAIKTETMSEKIPLGVLYRTEKNLYQTAKNSLYANEVLKSSVENLVQRYI